LLAVRAMPILVSGGAAMGQPVEGSAAPGLDDIRQVVLRPGDSMRIRPGTVHRMVALEDCDVLEASTPELDDVVRLEDRYGRT
jgi:mannose-6-phosphate isomerase